MAVLCCAGEVQGGGGERLAIQSYALQATDKLKKRAQRALLQAWFIMHRRKWKSTYDDRKLKSAHLRAEAVSARRGEDSHLPGEIFLSHITFVTELLIFLCLCVSTCTSPSCRSRDSDASRSAALTHPPSWIFSQCSSIMGNAASAEAQAAVAALKAGPILDPDALQRQFDALLPASGTTLPLEDLLPALAPDDVRGLRAQQPRNLALLLIDAVSLLSEHAEAAANDTPPPPARTAQTLNAARLLTRALPLVFESPDSPDEFVPLVFWQNCLPMPPRKAGKKAKAAAAAGKTASPSPRKDVYRYEKIDGADDSCV